MRKKQIIFNIEHMWLLISAAKDRSILQIGQVDSSIEEAIYRGSAISLTYVLDTMQTLFAKLLSFYKQEGT